MDGRASWTRVLVFLALIGAAGSAFTAAFVIGPDGATLGKISLHQQFLAGGRGQGSAKRKGSRRPSAAVMTAQSPGTASETPSTPTAFKDRYPLGTFEKKGWGGYLSSYKKDPARLLLALAEESEAKGGGAPVPLDFGPLFRPKMILLHDAEDVSGSPPSPPPGGPTRPCRDACFHGRCFRFLPRFFLPGAHA